ncbi:hypothetical protein Tco_0265934 [Tanacetum coccineum]
MFTRSLVIQKRVEDLQLGVESYQKKINVTKPETTRPSLRKRDPFTPYQDPQGFIYVDTIGKNRLMRSDELYKFSDRTLTGLRTSLDDITNNIRIKYLPKRRWSTLEKKRANIMIKAIDKQQKEKRMMRSLKKKKKEQSEIKRKVPTEMELVLEQTQHDTGYEVSVSAEGVEKLKRKVRLKGKKKEALLTLRKRICKKKEKKSSQNEQNRAGNVKRAKAKSTKV